MTSKAVWTSSKPLSKKYSSLYTKHCLITMKNVKRLYLMLSRTARSLTHNVNIGGTWVPVSGPGTSYAVLGPL